MLKNQLVNININDGALKEEIQKRIDEKIKEIGHNKILYSLEDLSHITSFSRGHIMNTFFNDERFKQIRRKVGRKWVFPVEETNEFLLTWIKEQPNE